MIWAMFCPMLRLVQSHAPVVALLHRLEAWMMVSRTGEITMLGPVQLLPYEKHQRDPRVSFRRAGGTQWDIVVRSNDELCLPQFL